MLSCFLHQSRRIKFVTALLLLLAGLLIADHHNPPPPLELDYSTRVYDRHGELLYRFASPVHGVYRYQRSNNQIPRHYEDALLAFEDRWYYYHPGVNPFSLSRGLWQWAVNGRIVSGGSTLTMQLARMMEDIPRTLHGKLRQIARAFQYEWRYSKQQILQAYIDKVPMGGAVEGVEAAARHYFSLPAEALTLSQSLVLAGIPQNPERLRPDLYPQKALQQRTKLLQRYGAIRTLSEEQISIISHEPVVVNTESSPQTGYWTAEALRRQFPKHTDLTSTLNLVLQQNLQSRLDRINHARDDAAAVLVLNNESGEIHARSVSTATNQTGNPAWLDLTQAIRSPGSTLKPFLYAQAIQQKLIHSESLLSDVPVSFQGYRPGNFNHRFHGAVSVSDALQHSLNVPAVTLLNKLGVESFSTLLSDAGLHQGQSPPNLSLVLGGTGTRLVDLVGAYRALAADGKRIRAIESNLNKTHEQQWLDAGATWIVAETLKEVAPPTGYRSRRKIAWKTGTSWGGRDAWAIGVSADYTVGVWMGSVKGTGNPNRSGYYDAGELLFDSFNLLPEDQRPWLKPDAVTHLAICWPGGRNKDHVAKSQCLQQRQAWSINAVTPATLDTPPNQWPDQLVRWQKDKRVAERWQGQPRIDSLTDDQQIGAPRTPIVLKATATGSIDWYLDGNILPGGILQPDISAGRHQLTAVDRFGRSTKIGFVVQ